MINPIFYTTQTTSFKGYNPNRKFDLTRIDDIPCPYCGEDMFSLSKFDKALDEAKTAGRMYAVGEMYEKYLINNEFYKFNAPKLMRNPRGFKYAIRNVFLPHASTIEHIIPQSEGGIDDISNYMTACYKCNSNRGSVNLAEMLKKNQNIENNIQKHIDYLKTVLPELIRQRKVSPNYENYPLILAKSLIKASNEKLDITV